MNTKFRPSNGTEGEAFIGAWCDRCARDQEQSCPILAATLALEVTHQSYPVEWILDANGQPQCTAFVHDGEAEPRQRCEHTDDMFKDLTP